MNDVLNSLKLWQDNVTTAFELSDNIDDCEMLRVKVLRTDLNQFEDYELAKMFQHNMLDKIVNKQKAIQDRCEYEATLIMQRQEQDDLAAMAELLNAGGLELIDKIKDGQAIEMPDLDNSDWSKFLTFSNHMVNQVHDPKYLNKQVAILHESMMAAITGIVTVYSNHIKQL